MAGERWREKLAEGKNLTAEDAKAIVTDVLGEGSVLMDKAGEEFVRMKEAGRDIVQMKDALKQLGINLVSDGDKGFKVELADHLKFGADHKDDMEFIDTALKEREAKKSGDVTPEMQAILDKMTGMDETIKKMGEDTKKTQETHQAELVESRARTRISTMLTGAAAEGIVIGDEFVKGVLTSEIVTELAAKIDASDEEFGGIVGQKVVTPALQAQKKMLEKLGVQVDERGVPGVEVTVPEGTPGPLGSPFNRGIGRTPEQPNASGAEGFGNTLGPNSMDPRFAEGEKKE